MPMWVFALLRVLASSSCECTSSGEADAAVVGDAGVRQVSTCCVKRWRNITTVTVTGASAMRGTTSPIRRRVPYLARPPAQEQSSTSRVRYSSVTCT